jgi:hypothetical protein
MRRINAIALIIYFFDVVVMLLLSDSTANR